VAEWLKAPVLKTGVVETTTEGSNPSLSVSEVASKRSKSKASSFLQFFHVRCRLWILYFSSAMKGSKCLE
jgi:hypothetical protein